MKNKIVTGAVSVILFVGIIVVFSFLFLNDEPFNKYLQENGVEYFDRDYNRHLHYDNTRTSDQMFCVSTDDIPYPDEFTTSTLLDLCTSNNVYLYIIVLDSSYNELVLRADLDLISKMVNGEGSSIEFATGTNYNPEEIDKLGDSFPYVTIHYKGFEYIDYTYDVEQAEFQGLTPEQVDDQMIDLNELHSALVKLQEYAKTIY